MKAWGASASLGAGALAALGALGARAEAIALAGLRAADPAAAVLRGLAELTLPEAPGSVSLLSIGKAGPAMARALAPALGDRLAEGLVVGKRAALDVEGAPAEVAGLPAVFAEHPVPGAQSLRAGKAVRGLLARAGAAAGERVVLVAISGGASALVASPRDGLTLAALAATTDALVKSGADIQAINSVRKHLEVLKGGGMVAAAAPARVVALIISDVVGDALDAIASGPTVPDTSTWVDVESALSRCHGGAVPPAVGDLVAAGRAGEIPETPAPGDSRFEGSEAVLVASPAHAVAAAAAEARSLGYRVETGVLEGEARVVGAALAARLRAWATADLPRCLILGGETTVFVRGAGRGGRNQELALAAATELAGLEGALVLSLGTDGEDGPTDAAGGVASAHLRARLEAAGYSAERALAENDAYPALAAAEHLLLTGPTGTNVCDLVLAVYDPRLG